MQRSEKSLQTTSLCYYVAKYTLKTLLTVTKVEKTKHEILILLIFFFLLLLLYQAQLKKYTVCANIKHTKQLLCL